MKMIKRILVGSVLFAQAAFAAKAPFFACEQSIEGQSVYLLVTQRQGKLVASWDWGRGVQKDSATYLRLTKSEAQDNSFVTDLADQVLGLNWRQVATVEVFEVGNYSDDAAGALGIQFLNSKGGLITKGMWLGWGGPMSCKKVVRKPIGN